MTDYTAPWAIVDDLEGREIGYRAILDADGYTVCNPSPMGSANAALIAAAPDLLEAVMLAEENLAPIYASDHIVLRKLRAAIGAATASDPRKQSGDNANTGPQSRAGLAS
jgi:hypothetical protein